MEAVGARMSSEKKLEGGSGRQQRWGEGSELRHSATFVITLWIEGPVRPQQPDWRWRVIEVESGERRYFWRLADVLLYVSERAGVPPPA